MEAMQCRTKWEGRPSGGLARHEGLVYWPQAFTRISSVTEFSEYINNDERVKPCCYSHDAMATQRIVDRLHAVSLWLQTGAVDNCDAEAAAWHSECRALGAIADKELAVWKALCSSGSRQPTVPLVRLCALLSVFTAGAHVRLDAHAVGSLAGHRTKVLNAADKLALFDAVASWVEDFLDWEPSPATSSAPSAIQLGLAQALLRAQVLEGYSRQLSSSLPAFAAHEQATDCSAVLIRFNEQLAAAISLMPCLSHTIRLLKSLAGLSQRFPTIRLTHKAQALAAASALGLGGTEAEGTGAGREAGSGEEGDDAAGRQGGSNPDEEWASSALEGAPQQVLELLDALGSSGVVEHASRAVLLLAGWVRELNRYGGMHRQLGTDPERKEQEHMQGDLEMMQHIRGMVGALHVCAVGVNGVYSKLSNIAYYPGALFGDGYVARTAARVPSGATAVGYLDAFAVSSMAPLEACCLVLDAPRVALLRRVLTGPCARHLVLSMGLRTLSALDGGSMYGLPQGAGMEALVGLHNDGSKGDEQQQQQQQQHSSQQVRLLAPQSLRSLLMLLAVRPCDPAGTGPQAEAGIVAEGGTDGDAAAAGDAGTAGEAGAEAGSGVAGPPRAERPAKRGLPCRAVRLEVTLRVARAAAGAAARAEDCGAPGASVAPCYRLELCGAASMSAVQALQFAWRHMPKPPRNGGDGGRRRAAMREWAAAMADVASSGVVAHAPKNLRRPWRLGLLLGLAPHVVGPMSRRGALWVLGVMQIRQQGLACRLHASTGTVPVHLPVHLYAAWTPVHVRIQFTGMLCVCFHAFLCVRSSNRLPFQCLSSCLPSQLFTPFPSLAPGGHLLRCTIISPSIRHHILPIGRLFSSQRLRLIELGINPQTCPPWRPGATCCGPWRRWFGMWRRRGRRGARGGRRRGRSTSAHNARGQLALR